jgi:hypothetical protein
MLTAEAKKSVVSQLIFVLEVRRFYVVDKPAHRIKNSKLNQKCLSCSRNCAQRGKINASDDLLTVYQKT